MDSADFIYVYLFININGYTTTMDKEEQVMSLGCGEDMKGDRGRRERR